MQWESLTGFNIFTLLQACRGDRSSSELGQKMEEYVFGEVYPNIVRNPSLGGIFP